MHQYSLNCNKFHNLLELILDKNDETFRQQFPSFNKITNKRNLILLKLVKFCFKKFKKSFGSNFWLVLLFVFLGNVMSNSSSSASQKTNTSPLFRIPYNVCEVVFTARKSVELVMMSWLIYAFESRFSTFGPVKPFQIVSFTSCQNL